MHRSATHVRSLAIAFLSLAMSFAASAATEPAGPMAGGREAFGAAPLADGRALVVGGFGGPGLMYTAEIYDPATTTFSTTGSLITPRASPAAAPLPDGRVLVLGGAGPGDANHGTLPLASAEIYDPATGVWSVTGSMSVARRVPVALSLPDGRVLVIGGDTNALTCEIFDPATETFSTTGSLTVGRASFAASVLQDGRVLVVGGVAPVFGTNLAEVWDPLTGLWSAVGPMAQPRVDASATTLQNGTVLVTGGQTGYSTNIFIAAAELFDPATGTFTDTGSLNQARSEHVAARLPDGRVVIAGGTAADQYASDGVEIYDAALGTWSVVGALTEGRRGHSGVLLADGSLLVAGGFNELSSEIASAEIVDPVCMASPATISPSSASFTSVTASDIVSVTHVAGCTWRATGAPAWLTITSGAQGSGTGAVSYSVADNTGAARTATLDIAHNPFTVSQDANPCLSATLSPTSENLGPTAWSSTIGLLIPGGCAWSVTGAPAWMTITSGGTGPAAIAFTVAQNLGVARNATLTIAGASLYVSQPAGPCVPSPTISPTGRSIAAAGGNSTVNVTAPAACPWTVTGAPPWISMFTSGSGNATLSFTAEANPNATSRSAFFTVAGNTFAVVQDANLCGGATLNPSSVSLPNTSTTGTIALTAASACAWTISGAPPWINFPSGYSGTGSATLAYQVGSNNGLAQSATMTIAGAKLTLSQAQGSCYPSTTISPASSPTFGAPGGSFTVTVTAQPSCSWTAWNFPSWITPSTPLPQTGSGTFTYTVAANSGASRSAMPAIAGSTHSVTQSAGPCAGSTISPTSGPTFPGAGASFTVNVTAQPGCTWTVTGLPAWITVTSPLPVTGSGSVTYSVAANGGAARSASIVIAGVTHSVSQSAGACFGSTISPTSSPTFPGAGASFTVNVTTQAGCSWTVTGLPAWISVTSPLPVTGSGGVTYSVAANSGAARSTFIVIAGVAHVVSQSAGVVCAATLSSTSGPTFAVAGGSASVNVTIPAGCSWTVTGAPAWITVTSPLPAGGSGSLSYSVAANSGAARSATLVIAGVNYAVSQSGAVTPPATYCSSQGSSTGFEWISQTTIAGVVRSSGNNGGYADFTASAAIALARGSNAASLVPGFSSGAYTENWRVWIDFNHDSVFSDTEIVYSGASSGALNASIVVPASALSGPTRMRVSMMFGGAPPACGAFGYGEVEDYTVTIP
jgi:hypothetical protein